VPRVCELTSCAGAVLGGVQQQLVAHPHQKHTWHHPHVPQAPAAAAGGGGRFACSRCCWLVQYAQCVLRMWLFVRMYRISCRGMAPTWVCRPMGHLACAGVASAVLLPTCMSVLGPHPPCTPQLCVARAQCLAFDFVCAVVGWHVGHPQRYHVHAAAAQQTCR
jgi:hypothetical protein